MNPTTAIGSVLRELRGKRSLREIGKISGVSYGHIRNIENGMDPRTGKEINPSPEVLKKLAQFYNFPYINLMHAAGYFDVPFDNKEDESDRKIHFPDDESKNYYIERSDDIYHHPLWVLSMKRAKVNGHLLSSQENERFERAYRVFIEAFFPDYFAINEET